MSENTDNAVTPSFIEMSLEGETLAYDSRARSQKAHKQLRDKFGRWLSDGANVKWDDNGVARAGTVSKTVNGQVMVSVRNPDGTVSLVPVDPNKLKVLASKATLPLMASRIQDPKNNFANAMRTPEYTKAMSSIGQATIQRADGYALSAIRLRDDSTGNPIMYQLFAPGGRSLGKYSAGAEADFDGMVSADQAASGPASSGVTASGEEKPYRVPENVKAEINKTLSEFSSFMPPQDVEVATRLANDSTVSISDVQWVFSFFDSNDMAERIRGGFRGRKWASKIILPSDDEDDSYDGSDYTEADRYDFDDDTFAYFAIGNDEESSLVYSLISVDYETGAVYRWGPTGFELDLDTDIELFEEPQIIPIDQMTAEDFAKWLDHAKEESYDILDTDPEERNLFSMAEAELDFEELDRLSSIIADASGLTDGYTPIERSSNAKKQRRGPGGKFGEQPKASTPPAKGPAEVKAHLPQALPLVPNVGARIQEWLKTALEAPVVAAGEATQAPAPSDYPASDQAIEDNATGPKGEAVYFAIVDDTDKTAVLDAVAIVKVNGAPQAWVRKDGSWQASSDLLTQLTGATPPPVVEMAIPEPVKTVLQQIDSHDSGADSTPEPEQVDPNEQVIAASAGYCLPDGSLPIFDTVGLLEAVIASASTEDIFTKSHIRKRARALNRMDLVPEDWRTPSLAEIGELSASETLYGEFGEILPVVAGGVPGVADTPGDFKNAHRLKAYWTHGKGALKIRWGTKGDLTRAHRHLVKYVGPRAWGLAQEYHKYLFGVYNYTHDVATGQYVPHHRRKK